MPYHHGDLPDALVRAARRLLKESSDPISIRGVARLVGVSANAPYRHFEDRETLLAAVAAQGYRDAARQLSGAGGPERVAAVWQRLADREPRLVVLMTTAIGAGGTATGPLREAVGEWLGEVARAIEADRGGEDPAAVLTSAVACWAAVHGLVTLKLAGALAGLDDWLLPAPEQLARRAVGG